MGAIKIQSLSLQCRLSRVVSGVESLEVILRNAKVVSSIPIIGTKLEKPILADGLFLLRQAFSAQGVKSVSLPFPHIAERP